ncbi:RHS repeat domain-containing protein [Planosporangium sp. 12N6]|uniref:RHS repeat domain-containing protein n=1 Tax=Planosporangium spinosum TaxID=3402278 RepID=UPI003CF143A5
MTRRTDPLGRRAEFGYDANGLRLSATSGSGAKASTQRWAWDVSGTLPEIALDPVTDAALVVTFLTGLGPPSAVFPRWPVTWCHGPAAGVRGTYPAGRPDIEEHT